MTPVLQALVGERPETPQQLVPVARVINEARRSQALEEFVAGALSTTSVVELLPSISTPQGVHRLGDRGRLLRRTVGRVTYWPAWQFGDEGLRRDLPQLLALLWEYVDDDAVAADRVMRWPREELGGRSIAGCLDDDPGAWRALRALGGGF